MFKHRQLLSLAFVMTFAVSGVYAMDGGGAAGAGDAGDDAADVAPAGLFSRATNATFAVVDKVNVPANLVLDKAADLVGGAAGLLKKVADRQNELAVRGTSLIKLGKATASAWVAYLLVNNEKVNEKLSDLSQALKRTVGLGKCDAGACTKSGVCNKAKCWDKQA